MQLELRHQNLKVLDLFDVFCPGDVCMYQAPNGEFMYRDEYSHPSAEASIISQAKLLESVRDLMAKMSENTALLN